MPDSTALKTFVNPDPERETRVEHVTEEFTFLYPLTEQPSFGVVEIEYTPDRSCLETVALKTYLNSYRDESHHFEAVANRVLDGLHAACAPREIRVTIRFNVRGGIETKVTAEVHGE